jgi:subtilase family serine protease
MTTLRPLIAAAASVAAVTALAGFGVGSAAAATSPAARTALAGSRASFARPALATGTVAAGRRLTIQLWLKPDLAAAQRFATAVSTPGGRSFHRYLSPGAYTTRFGPAAAAVRAAEDWLRAEGFTGVSADPGHAYVRATGTAARIDAALRVTLRTYRASAAAAAGPYTLYANDRPVTLPAALARDVLGVTGLDNAAPVIPLIKAHAAPRAATAAAGSDKACSDYYGQRLATGLPKAYGITKFPTLICGYTATQMREAYRATTTATGRGVTIALVEQGLAPDMFQTLTDYDHAGGLAPPVSGNYAELSQGRNTCGDPFNGEEQLDVEISHAMAPDARQLVIGGDSCNNGDFGLQGLFDADTVVLDGASGHPLATIASNSWGSGGDNQPAEVTTIEHAYLVRAAAEGVGMYFSAGDGSGVLAPANDPYAIAVGGTSLGIGASGQRLFETGWSTGASEVRNGRWVLQGEDGASGGGSSTRWAEPAFQKGVVPAALSHGRRTVPDLAASADPFTGTVLGILNPTKAGEVYTQIPIGGTSESSPLVAGIVAAAQQGQAQPFGFLDPAIYRLAGTSAFFDLLPLTSHSPGAYRGVECDLAEFADICDRGNKVVPTLTTFDDQSPAMKGYTGQVTARGFDTMTGLGAPDSPHFIAALRAMEG